MAILKKLFPLISTVMLSGCYEDFTPGIDTVPVLCLNSLISAGKPMDISVTRTWLYTDISASANHQVDDATVTVYVNGERRDSGYIPKEGDNIRIVADSPTYGNAEAEVTVPVSVPIERVKWDAVVTDLWQSELPDYEMLSEIKFNLNVKLTVEDPMDVANYYHLSFDGFYTNLEGERKPVDRYGPEDSRENYVRFYLGNLMYEAEPIFSEHVGLLDVISGNDTSGFTFFTDRQFPGGTYTLHLQFDGMTYYVNFPRFEEQLLDCGVRFTLTTVSESYYNWANYKSQTEDGVIADLGNIGLSEPIAGYSNVSTGAGVVAAGSSATYIVSLKDFLSPIIN